MFKLNAVSLAVTAALSAVALPVLAQETTTGPQLERVVVTGSAIKRLDAETAVPVTVVKMDDLKQQGITSVEQVMSVLSAAQMSQGTSQVVGSGSGGAAFADLRGIGANKTLVLLNGRRIANNALDSSAPDLNMIPFAAIQRVEVLRDGASALYGTDAIGGVINFITRKDMTGGSITVGADSPQHAGGKSYNLNAGYGFGDLDKNGFNVFGFVDYKTQNRISGTDRPFNKRIDGGLSPSTSPANYYQDDKSGNPTAPNCTSSPNLISDGDKGCLMTTSSFVNYIPKTERLSGLIAGTAKLSADHQVGLEYFASRSKVDSLIAPVPYGGLMMNPYLPDGVTPNPYYPGNSGSGITTPNIPLSAAYTGGLTDAQLAAKGLQKGFINVKWRDLPNGSREDISTNTQQRFVASLEGALAGWDYQTAYTYNVNKYTQELAGYSDGGMISDGVLNGVINPFGDQSAAGTALLDKAALSGLLQTAKGTVQSIDARASRELGDWLHAGRPAAIALGAEYRHEKFTNAANFDFASKVIASTGIDPNTLNEGSRNITAAYTELNVPIVKELDITAAVRYDKYSDFGSSTNPKIGFRFQPMKQLLLRGSYSTGFRAPSLYEINSAPYYTNTSTLSDPINCPGGVALPGKPSAANCKQQFQALYGGNANLQPEKAKNATFGLLIEPTRDLNFGADFWWLQVRNSIGSLVDKTVFADPTQYASVYHRNPQGNLSTDGSQCPDPATCGYVDLRTQNLGGVRTHGFDFSANFHQRAGAYGDFSLGLQSTYVMKYEYQNVDGGAWFQKVGVYSGDGPIFRWQHNANLSWSKAEFAAGLSAHFKSGYTDEYEGHHVGSYTTFDAYGSWAVAKSLSLTVGIRNLFDRDPSFTNQDDVFQAGYDPRYADPTGRTFYARASYKF
ncbi:MAG: TonB-dependent receptor [Burkholderiaceae bacterium]